MSPTVAGPGLRLQEVEFGWPGEPPIFSNLNLEIPSGNITALVGKSGCGKSTLLRIAASLIAPQKGRIEGALKHCALVFQSPNLLPWRSLRDNVALPLELQGEPDWDRVDATIETLGLSDYANRLPAVLSGGMKMRAALARALVTQPSLLLLDEPFAALDAITRRHVHQEFLSLWRELGFTAVLVTHDIDEAVLIADQVLILGSDSSQSPRQIPIDLPRPRGAELRHHPRTGALVSEIEACL
ncbi:MAG: ABC transporter ATP-binding protein [Myxococcota bacterium]|nr:ABC transporter ATP-binding protein [Myxococcota bacterium]